VPLDLLAQLAQELRLGGNRLATAQPSRWRPFGPSDADEALLGGMAAVSLYISSPSEASSRADPAAVVHAPLGWREFATACQVSSPRKS
jgi:hypothetical protein